MHIQYSKDGNVATYCGYKFRRDPKTGYYLSSRNTDTGHRERLHCFVWRMHNGEIQDGYHIHHKDENKRNNDIENLCCIPGKLHATYHLSEYVKNNRDAVIENLNKNVVPKASEWHRSEAGRAWHREHYMESIGKAKPIHHKCLVCGKEFLSTKKSTKFCGNNCKSAYRRKLGVDNEVRRCIICGKDFSANKYSPKSCCSAECANTLRWNNRCAKSGERASI